MPLLQLPHAPISLRVADKKLSGVLFGQTATFISLHHEQAGTGECVAVVELLCQLHQLSEAGELGASVDIPGLGRYGAKLSSDNDTLVDAATGQILASLLGLSVSARAEVVAGFAQDTMLQGDFFEYLRENHSVKIGDMIRQHIQQADELGRFA